MAFIAPNLTIRGAKSNSKDIRCLGECNKSYESYRKPYSHFSFDPIVYLIRSKRHRNELPNNFQFVAVDILSNWAFLSIGIHGFSKLFPRFFK